MNHQPLTLGSLFDGSGGFPLAAKNTGIWPVWASEVEPFPILVTSRRLKYLTHVGDVSKLDGGRVEPVDIITFGSPCQDLSIAGRRAGLEGNKSNLFFEAIRVIKEMRDATGGQYPRFAVWENVPGAFSSNKGDDFHDVLKHLTAIIDEQAAAELPRPQRWERAGAIVGDGYSLAWRVLDAQFFGVPQRRRRIFLIADFGSQRAPEILFDPHQLSNSAGQSEEVQQATTTPAGNGAEGTSKAYCLRMRQGKPGGGKGPLIQTELSGTLATGNDQTVFAPVAYGFNAIRPKWGRVGKYGYPLDIAKTLDTKGTCPDGAQGGIAVVDEHERTHVVRRLTPVECARLQGFPDEWAENLGYSDPTDEQLVFWQQVFDTWGTICGLKTRKTKKQIRAWLADPFSKTAVFKLWGNGVALPVVEHVLTGIRELVEAEQAST
ncbi:DNA cytosine methyltransferase [Corynebacterium kozikiae]|uniref:DNA cytosine methyltransferase n=1 Tax=Corynebacterium kozikiae TaxID=2968469 RepID=UPI00211C4A91|nr:DNA cytosine methyltransferase [Corynebacterium sp. 76QC2CO]MCI6574733.1 DNA cytosine methyltransferase [Arcanobacterium sp.]MCQ9343826.1 DNA cytosine methyltransferase [Corynebacterium sp. 76QC2CO]MDY5854462.1 DNA cytosine methyltransferase [Arcanobacterium sp.]